MGKVTVHHSTHLTAAKCLRAGFMSSASDTVVTLVALVAVAATLALTVWLRKTAAPSSKEKEVPAAAATPSTESESAESENAPPPYEPPASSLPTSEPAPKRPVADFPNPEDTAHAFVLGTVLFAAQTFMLVTLGFCIQHFNYCPKVEINAPLSTGSIIIWFLYAWLVLIASSGFVSWGLLCWYVGGGKKQDFVLDIIPLGLIVATLMPFMLLFMGAVQAVRGCQKWLCGVTFEEQHDVLEEVETDVELQRLIKGDNDGDDDKEEVASRS